MIPTELIERALALTGKTMKDVMETTDEIDCETNNSFFRKFSIEKFFAYILSPSFIETYRKPSTYEEGAPEFEWRMQVEEFGEAIYAYQKNNPKILIDLLEKLV